MVVSGTVTDKMAPAVQAAVRADARAEVRDLASAPAPTAAALLGLLLVTKGVDQMIPVDVYVPGCPPRPEALLHGIMRLQDKIGERADGS